MGVLLWLLAGCDAVDSGPNKLRDYLQRLVRGLDVEVPAAPLVAPPRIVDAALRPLPVAMANLSVLDFLALSGCELQVNLGRRNSSLGRHASASQRLLLDLEFLDLAPGCVEHLSNSDNPELASEIQRIAAERRRLLPLRIYNAVLAGYEFQSFWRLPPNLDNYPTQTSSEVVDALAWLQSAVKGWLNGNTSGSFEQNQALEGHLATLRAGDGGALLLAAAEASRSLQQATGALDASQRLRNLCPGQQKSRRAEIVETVTVKFFAGEVQPWLAALNRRHHGLITPLLELEGHLSAVLPTEYLTWQRKRDSLLATLHLKPKEHVTAIKSALADCPGVPWSGSESSAASGPRDLLQS